MALIPEFGYILVHFHLETLIKEYYNIPVWQFDIQFVKYRDHQHWPGKKKKKRWSPIAAYMN